MPYPVVDSRITGARALVSPKYAVEQIPASSAVLAQVSKAREMIADVIHARDDRLVVVCGPCSVHDPDAAMEYARLLATAAREHESELLVIMRVYFEKPRTSIGWKGLINDPGLDNSYSINNGLIIARQLLKDINELGLPAGTEFLDPIIPQYISDLVSWGAIGARTTESQIHRALISGISCPAGFKNGTDGGHRVAVEAMQASAHSHTFLGITPKGETAIFTSSGNTDTHVILRGGRNEPNYEQRFLQACREDLEKAGFSPRIMIDMSHGNSRKSHKRQLEVCAYLCSQIQAGDSSIAGVMLESNLVEGNQALKKPADLMYGQSITDACVNWDDTQICLQELGQAVRARRAGG